MIEQTSYIWARFFSEIELPKNGVVVEVAPGYEPKIGRALAMLNFCGTIYVIEPDSKAASAIKAEYERILPKSTIKTIIKSLQEIKAGVNIPLKPDALVASHPFDDMVMETIVEDKNFFSLEKEGGAKNTHAIKKIYNALEDKDYRRGISTTIKTWKKFIDESKPCCCIISQYPSYTLTKKGLTQRQESGFAVLKRLKRFYRASLVKQCKKNMSSSKEKPKWWLICKKPLAIKRLGESIFVPQKAIRLSPRKYKIVYIDKQYFDNTNKKAVKGEVKKLAVVLSDNYNKKTIITYADKQKDKTGIGLSGNLGSGRAIYYGKNLNILGVGKTTLCRSKTPNHSTGKLEIVGAMRRIIVAKWANHFGIQTPAHIALIALKEQAKYKWNDKPIPLSLLVRVDNGSLDRPSHVEQSPKISIDFKKIITKYAELDAKYFAYRFMLGAWSTSNYSLNGDVIDLESASFTKYRGPYYTSSAEHPHNRFGYEGLGFQKILHQIAAVKGIDGSNVAGQFFRKRRVHLGRCFLTLLGIENTVAAKFFNEHKNQVMKIADQFEKLSKKISPKATTLRLYVEIQDEKDPSLLDMSNLFRNLAKLLERQNRKTEAFKYLIRQKSISEIKSNGITIPLNQREKFLRNKAVVTQNELNNFLNETKNFIAQLFQLLDLLNKERGFSKNKEWDRRLQNINQNLPTMFELNTTLKSLAELYRRKKLSAKKLDVKIKKLSKLSASIIKV